MSCKESGTTGILDADIDADDDDDEDDHDGDDADDDNDETANSNDDDNNAHDDDADDDDADVRALIVTRRMTSRSCTPQLLNAHLRPLVKKLPITLE